MGDPFMTDEEFAEQTDFGFTWGNISIIRTGTMRTGRDSMTRIVSIEVNDERRLDIYISEKGRSVRVFDYKTHRELH
jgi:hypothetical protein